MLNLLVEITYRGDIKIQSIVKLEDFWGIVSFVASWFLHIFTVVFDRLF